ncbi:Ferredoxin-type protein NapH [Candidatus Magnetaquicoccaceae bacterium FCR-1]|uniref:Ferredoxin-type protein NapH n=1 Tax=Candidatus Magnetaquiglobus chichijimensis TaxID=3141448 RepID=A0ABQ0CC79_9PROT
MKKRLAGDEAIEKKGWWPAHRWLVWRRLSQLGVLGLFLLGPAFDVWLIQGNLSASLFLDTLPMTDPLLFAQLLATSGMPATQAMLGFVVVVALYGLLGGRTFCAWVCPVNPIADLAAWMRRRFGIGGGWRGDRRIRHAVLVVVVATAGLSGLMVWEWINPMSLLHRGLIFGVWSGWLAVVGIFLFDLILSPHGWCGRLCPTGAVYALLGRRTPLAVSAVRRDACTDCRACHQVCPEAAVIDPALKGADKGVGPRITGMDCTRCGRCIDVCPDDVFEFDFHLPNISRVVP